MRITPEMLLKIARDTAAQRARTDFGLIGVYLQGSVLRSQPLLGGTTDIDLFFIHNDQPPAGREIVRLTEEVTLDIAHHSRDLYRQGRDLRRHPWLGPGVDGCKIILDPHHFLDFTLASIRSQINHPENVLARARSQAEHARQEWLSFQFLATEPGLDEISLYLKAVAQAAHAISSLNGALLTERRFLLDFPERAASVGRPGLYAGLLGLLGASSLETEKLHAWLGDWRGAYEAAAALYPRAAGEAQDFPLRLHSYRLPYYLRAFEAMAASEQPVTLLWPLLHTWTEAVAMLPADAPQRASWQAACQQLHLNGAAFTERLAALDAFLDNVEELLDEWGRANGI